MSSMQQDVNARAKTSEWSPWEEAEATQIVEVERWRGWVDEMCLDCSQGKKRADLGVVRGG